ncbi:hypothetical protein [Streptomyces sp. NPDC029554]|uniref:hypothetical protein n=1 Tax=Streptomyces sp. NPDC029554 TaxID=3155126 RepID=UPI0034029402
MNAPLPFVPSGRTLTGGELLELAGAVARVPAGEGFCFDETFIHRMRREPGAGPTVTIRAYSPPLERTGQYGEAEDGLLHRVPASSEEHLSPKDRQGTPSTFSDGDADAEAEVGVEVDERESGGPRS